MQASVLLFGRLRREAGAERFSLTWEGQLSVAEAARRVERETGLSLAGCMAALGRRYAAPGDLLSDGCELAFLPPVAGGSGDCDHLGVGLELLDLAAADAFLRHPRYGAQAYFCGTVRSPNAGLEVTAIVYEAYLPMAREVLGSLAEQVRARYQVGRLYLVHRVGRLAPAEASVLIGVASEHRRDALAACGWLIEAVKRELPIWKLELGPGGERWVEGQAPHPTL